MAETSLELVIRAKDMASQAIQNVSQQTGRLQRAIDNLNQRAQRAQEAMARWRPLENVMNRLTIAATALAGAMGMMAWKAMQAAMEEERFATALTALLGAERARELIRFAEEFAQRYGFYVEDVKDALMTLVGVARRTGISITDALLIAARLAAATGKPITEMAQAVMMAFQGWPRALRSAAMGLIDIKEIQAVTTQAMVRQAKQMQESGETVAEGMEEVELSAGEAQRIMEVLQQQTAGLQPTLVAFSQTHAAMWERMRSALRGAWEQLGFALFPLIQKLLPYFTELIQKITDFIERHEGLVRAAFQWAGYIAAAMIALNVLTKLFILAQGVMAFIGVAGKAVGAVAGAAGAGGGIAGALAGVGGGALAGLGGAAAIGVGLAALSAGAAGLGTYLGTRHYLAPWTRAQREVAEYQKALQGMSPAERAWRLWGRRPTGGAVQAMPVVIAGDVLPYTYQDEQMAREMQRQFGYGGW